MDSTGNCMGSSQLRVFSLRRFGYFARSGYLLYFISEWGWTCVLAFTQLLNSLSPAAFGWLLAGGIIYTVGGVIMH